jgi:uncharacterized protein YbbK (DUF523 family)
MMKKKKILVSACLMEELVRYDGEILPNCPPILKEWEKQGFVIPVCPEVAAGMPTPRPPAECQSGDGKDVVAGKAKVVEINGKDVTNEFITGAKEALRLAQENDVVCAILKALSPSCGSKQTYDGSFSDVLIEGQGVTAAMLEKMGIRVFNENEIEQVAELIGG